MSEGRHDPDPASAGGPVLDADGLTDERLTGWLLAKSPRENFPVASRLLPARLRRDLLALYGFARLVDDLGDEAPGAPGDREHLLDLVEADLDRACRTTADGAHAAAEGDGPALPVLRELAGTVRAHRIPAGPFRDLIAANRQDQKITEYQTYADLVGYCALSADPVGRIVLHIFDAATPERVRLSDRICTALQIAEHLQDVAEDLRAGRVYLPAEDLRRFGCTRADLALPVAPERVRRLIGFQRRRARALLDAGTPLVPTLPGLARLAVAGYVAGGRAALAAVAAAGDDVLSGTPRPARSRLLTEWLVVAAGGGAG
ncbi:MAG TPA: squalene synthase HpnC [Mycobacteriales bacterium]|nr:squalene synthase HpnC [Mycobacteriales bacterium]